MNGIIESLQQLASSLPPLFQPLISALAGAIPFVEGEGGAALGILVGVPPIVAIIAGIVGNFACVFVLAMVAAKTREAVVTRRAAGQTLVAEAPSPRNRKVLAALEKYGVPGVSLLGPLLVPTMFTATALVAAGVRPGRVLFWQGLAIVLWTTAIGVLVALGLSALVH